MNTVTARLTEMESRRRFQAEVSLITKFKRSGIKRGSIQCPICDKGMVRVELTNEGGSSGCCSTEGCLKWME